MKIKTAGLAALVLVLSLPAFAQSLADHPRLKSALMLLEVWTDAQQAYEQIPGASMAVVYDQTLLWSRGFGYADLQKKVSTTPTTIYSICSISKLFTSVAALSLRDQGKLRLDDPLEKLLPWFSIEKVYPGFGPATVKGILTHSSGLPRESDFPYWTAPDFAFPTHEQIIERLKNQRTLYPADAHFQYSNLGMTLAGEIIARLSGRSYADYVTEKILRPLKLTDTQPRMPEEHRGGRLATGYSAMTREGTRVPLPFFQANGITPAAGFSSTVEDLGRFASWQFRLLEKGGTEILDANTLREMHRVQWLEPDWRTAYGLGFAVWQKDDKTFVGHEGSCPGYRSSLLLQPKEKIAVAFAANASGVDAGKFTQIAYAIVAPAIAEANDPGKPPKPLDPSLQPYIGIYSDFPWGGETAIVYGGDGIAAVDLPSIDPLAGMQKLKHISGNTFRRVRKDGELGEEVIFEVGDDGTVTRLKWHSNYQVKIRTISPALLLKQVRADAQKAEAPSPGSIPPQSKDKTAEQELLKLEHEWEKADLANDWTPMERILADDYILAGRDGGVYTKDQCRAAYRSEEGKILALVTDDMKVRVYGDAAVVTMRSAIKEVYQGKEKSDLLRITNTWIKKAGRWQCVSTHSSRIAEK